jgi:hypothetical protein
MSFRTKLIINILFVVALGALVFIAAGCSTTHETRDETIATNESVVITDSVIVTTNPHSFDADLPGNIEYRNDRIDKKTADSIISEIDPIVRFETTITENDGQTRRRIKGQTDVKRKTTTISSVQVSPDKTVKSEKKDFKTIFQTIKKASEIKEQAPSWMGSVLKWLFIILGILMAGFAVYIIIKAE